MIEHHYPDRGEIHDVLELVGKEAAAFLDGLDARAVRPAGADQAVRPLDTPLPEVGEGATAALRALLDHGLDGALSTAGPRTFHFVIGGVTPAALGADWLTTVLDQIAYAWVTSPLGVELERISLAWLRELFELPAEGGGVLTTGATMANFVGLATARQWWGEKQGFDVAEHGLTGRVPVKVFSSGLIHASAIKALAMLGIGRSAVRRITSDATGKLDVDALERELRALDGAPAILIGNAGEVNAGQFDPIDQLADLASRHGAWLHVDGAFGLFARLSPRTAELCAGVEQADSITADGHKWLNVPYDCGFAFVRDEALQARTFAYDADYLPGPDDPRPNFGVLGPESSRRARALSVWATLRAYGRSGYRALVEHHLDLAQHLAARVDAAPQLERLADVQLNIVCFRYNPGGVAADRLERINQRLGELILEDGRFYAGTTLYEGKVALRPAMANWRSEEADIDAFVDVVVELGAVAAKQA